MKKNVIITLLIVLFTFPTLSAQSFLKKIGDATKKVTGTEQKKESVQAAPAETEVAAPISFKIESTRVIGNQLLISGKVHSFNDMRLMGNKITAISPDGETYESKMMWWGGVEASPMSFDKNLTAEINYAIDIAIEVKGKMLSTIGVLTLNAFDHSNQKYFKIQMKDIAIPMPVDPNLSSPSVIEIYKDVYLRWTKAEESANGLKISFVVENKASKDQELKFYSYNKAKITDNEGNSFEGDITLRDRITFPSETPIAGSITFDKPVKMNQIALLEFASSNFTYKIRKVVIPTN